MLREIKKRNGDVVPFDRQKIFMAMKKAFAGESMSVDDMVVEQMADRVVAKTEAIPQEQNVTVEHVQDFVEETLMERGYFKVAKAYILYRFEHTKERKEKVVKDINENRLMVAKRDGSLEPFSKEKVFTSLQAFVRGYEHEIDLPSVVTQVELEVYDGIKTDELARLITLVLRSRIEADPAYAFVSARQLCARLYKEIVGKEQLHDPSF